MNQQWFKGVLMITMMTTKDDEQKAQKIKEQLKWIKNKSRVQEKNQEEFKTQEESLETRIKIQGSRSQESRSRFKNEEKNQSSIKKFFKTLNSTWVFDKTLYQRVFTLW